MGFPDRDHLVARYSEAAGVDTGELHSYLAFAHFKSVGIAQGIAARVAAGQMAGQDFGDLDAEIVRIAQTGLDLYEQGI